MYQESQRGFAVAAIVGIVAILALLGGGAYVATKYDADVDTDVSTTTDSMRFDGDVTVTKDADKATTTLDASTTIHMLNPERDISTDVNAGADINLDYNY